VEVSPVDFFNKTSSSQSTVRTSIFSYQERFFLEYSNLVQEVISSLQDNGFNSIRVQVTQGERGAPELPQEYETSGSSSSTSSSGGLNNGLQIGGSEDPASATETSANPNEIMPKLTYNIA